RRRPRNSGGGARARVRALCAPCARSDIGAHRYGSRPRGGESDRGGMRRPRLDRGSPGRWDPRDSGTALLAQPRLGGDGRRGGVSTILLIEDNRDYAATLTSNLEREGYDVATASNGVDGLERARNLE